MHKSLRWLYLFMMALAVLSFSGCGGSSSGGGSSQTQAGNLMVITSPALKVGDSYKLYRGDKVGVRSQVSEDYNPTYYVAPHDKDEAVVMNLEFADSLSGGNQPFAITIDDDDGTEKMVFYYNPKGNGTTDTTTPNEKVYRYGGGTQQLSYNGLNVTGAMVDIDDTDALTIQLNGTSATISGTSVPTYDLVWHADPQHPAEYWTDGINGTTEYDADEYEEQITATAGGVYIAHDIRYTSDQLEFSTSQTAQKDEDSEYVVYYDTSSAAVREAIAALGETYGSAYSTDKYIFATLPMQNGRMGGPGGQGGTPPSGQGGPNGTPPNARRAADNSSIASFSTMTHSAEDAYNNPVLHITKAGTYKLTGTWNGQIWVEAGAKAQHQVALILDGVNVTCTAGPALVFYKVYKWAEDNGYDDQSTLTANDLWKNLSEEMISSDGYYDVGAIVEIADGSTNTFTGANTYRLLELSPKLDDDTELPKYAASQIGSNISAQQKMYKFDAAFHSRRTMVIGGGEEGTGKLSITSTTCEGLGSEMHLLIDGGVISVTATDDGINVNEDNVSVFTMDSGTLTVNSTGGDGIDSNGWVAVNGGTLNITAGSQKQNSAGEAGIDAENGVYVSDNATYNWSQAGSNTQPGTDAQPNTEDNSGGDTTTTTLTPIEVRNNNNEVVMSVRYSNPVSDSDTSDRGISESGNVFTLTHQVNSFSGVK